MLYNSKTKILRFIESKDDSNVVVRNVSDDHTAALSLNEPAEAPKAEKTVKARVKFNKDAYGSGSFISDATSDLRALLIRAYGIPGIYNTGNACYNYAVGDTFILTRIVNKTTKTFIIETADGRRFIVAPTNPANDPGYIVPNSTETTKGKLILYSQAVQDTSVACANIDDHLSMDEKKACTLSLGSRSMIDVAVAIDRDHHNSQISPALRTEQTAASKWNSAVTAHILYDEETSPSANVSFYHIDAAVYVTEASEFSDATLSPCNPRRAQEQGYLVDLWSSNETQPGTTGVAYVYHSDSVNAESVWVIQGASITEIKPTYTPVVDMQNYVTRMLIYRTEDGRVSFTDEERVHLGDIEKIGIYRSKLAAEEARFADGKLKQQAYKLKEALQESQGKVKSLEKQLAAARQEADELKARLSNIDTTHTSIVTTYKELIKEKEDLLEASDKRAYSLETRNNDLSMKNQSMADEYRKKLSAEIEEQQKKLKSVVDEYQKRLKTEAEEYQRKIKADAEQHAKELADNARLKVELAEANARLKVFEDERKRAEEERKRQHELNKLTGDTMLYKAKSMSGIIGASSTTVGKILNWIGKFFTSSPALSFL